MGFVVLVSVALCFRAHAHALALAPLSGNLCTGCRRGTDLGKPLSFLFIVFPILYHEIWVYRLSALWRPNTTTGTLLWLMSTR